MIEVLMIMAFIFLAFFATNGLVQKYGVKKSGTSMPNLDLFRDKKKK